MVRVAVRLCGRVGAIAQPNSSMKLEESGIKRIKISEKSRSYVSSSKGCDRRWPTGYRRWPTGYVSSQPTLWDDDDEHREVPASPPLPVGR